MSSDKDMPAGNTSVQVLDVTTVEDVEAIGGLWINGSGFEDEAIEDEVPDDPPVDSGYALRRKDGEES